jgi:hypothetical protein
MWKIVMAIIGIVVAGAVGGLISWGSLSTTVEAHGEKLARHEVIILDDGREQAGLKAQMGEFKEDIKEIKQDIKSILRALQNR